MRTILCVELYVPESVSEQWLVPGMAVSQDVNRNRLIACYLQSVSGNLRCVYVIEPDSKVHMCITLAPSSSVDVPFFVKTNLPVSSPIDSVGEREAASG